jgi:hypothetical protein
MLEKSLALGQERGKRNAQALAFLRLERRNCSESIYNFTITSLKSGDVSFYALCIWKSLLSNWLSWSRLRFGMGGIRTHGTVTRTPDFEQGNFVFYEAARCTPHGPRI